MPLPTKISEKCNDLSKQIILIYGRPKIGKSTLCSKFPDALFLATEPGLNHLEVFKISITNWESFLLACKDLSEGNHEFKTVIIDTADNLITYCADYICRINDLHHVSEMDHNMGWHLVTTELNRALVKLSSLPYGLVLVSHAKQIEVKTKTAKYDRFTIDIGGKNAKVILNMMDIILFMDSDVKDGKEIGVVRTKPSLHWEGGDKSKLLPENIEFPPDKPEAVYEVIKNAFKPTT